MKFIKVGSCCSLNKVFNIGLIFLNTWFTDFFFKILRSEEGKKNYYIFFLLSNLKHIWIRGNCMILHSKNAEMAIFFYFFLINSGIFLHRRKYNQKYIFFFFLKCKNLGRRIRKPRNKKKIALVSLPYLFV